MVGRRKSNLHLPPRMYMKGPVYYYVSRDNRWISLGRDINQARLRWAELEGKAPIGGMAGLMDRYLQDVVPTKAPRTQEDNRLEMVKLRAVFGAMDPRAIKPHHVAKYLDMRGKDAPTRANREKALLSHVFTMAMRWGEVDANPCRGVKRNREAPRERYITDDEFLRVRASANATVQCLMDLAYMTAQRIGDLLRIKVSDITATGLSFKQGKTGKRLEVAMTPDLKRVLDRACGLHPRVRGMTVLCTRDGKPYSYDGASSMFKRAVVKAGVEDFHFHDIRAKALTDAKRAGMDAQALAGHATETMTAHYIKRRDVDVVTPMKSVA